MSAPTTSRRTQRAPRILITGGAGFIGTNLARHLIAQEERVRILDSLARRGSEANIASLLDEHRRQVEFLHEDVRDPAALQRAVRGVDHVVHLAAQVAVTTSLVEPRHDFEVNALGTLQLLEALRGCARPPSLLFTSTNKVYGILADVAVRATSDRYVPVDAAIAAAGIDETRPLDFHSPYGCSKGAADQYVLDYSRSFGLRAVVLRMSCIYGRHQNGNEDQGWVAHFVRSALAGEPVTIYGDGRQVRDALFVDDLVAAFEQTRHHIATLSGRAFNIGGGPDATWSILELVQHIERLTGVHLTVQFAPWRVGDQRYYVSDTRRFREATGWRASVDVTAGLQTLIDWFSTPPLTAGLQATARAIASGAHP